jgi:hypothetical protein
VNGLDTILDLMEVLMAIVDCFIMVFCGLGFYYAVDSILLSIEKN